MVVVKAASSSFNVAVRLAPDASSGLASIVQQYLEQQLAESADRRRRAFRIRGRLGLVATDYSHAVTVDFTGDEISVHDGMHEPLDARIAGTHQALTKLLQGEANPLIEHLRGRIKVTSKLRNLWLPLRVHRLMKLARTDAR